MENTSLRAKVTGCQHRLSCSLVPRVSVGPSALSPGLVFLAEGGWGAAVCVRSVSTPDTSGPLVVVTWSQHCAEKASAATSGLSRSAASRRGPSVKMHRSWALRMRRKLPCEELEEEGAQPCPWLNSSHRS